MPALDHRHLAEALLPSVIAAGALQMRYQTSGIAVEIKSDDSPVTAADREAEALLVAALNAAAPDVPVLAEERAAAGAVPEIAERFFAVDPLDGTKEFVAGRPEFTINVGLVESGLPRFGLIFAPALSALYVTLDAGAAYGCTLPVDGSIASLAGCALTRLAVRKAHPGALHALVSRTTNNAPCQSFLHSVGVSSSTQIGSSLKFCLIAAGEADVYARFGPTREWDTAAGHAILVAAGGSIVTTDGDALTYGKAAQGYLNPDFVAWGHRPNTVESP